MLRPPDKRLRCKSCKTFHSQRHRCHSQLSRDQLSSALVNTENTHPGPKDVMNWYSAQAECQKYGMSMLRISGEQKVITISKIVTIVVTDHQECNE